MKKEDFTNIPNNVPPIEKARYFTYGLVTGLFFWAFMLLYGFGIIGTLIKGY